MPMRIFPSSVCLLGMNDGIYPRNIQPLVYLMAEKRRRSDKTLMMTAICSLNA